MPNTISAERFSQTATPDSHTGEVVSDLVLVYGMPGVGKSVVAPSLARRRGLARLGKDDLKEALWDDLQRPSSLTPLEWSRHLGAIAYELLGRTVPRSSIDYRGSDRAPGQRRPDPRALPSAHRSLLVGSAGGGL